MDLPLLTALRREAPPLDGALSRVAPQPQLLDAALVTVQAMSLAGVHPSPSARRRRQTQILAALLLVGLPPRGKHRASAFILGQGESKGVSFEREGLPQRAYAGQLPQAQRLHVSGEDRRRLRRATLLLQRVGGARRLSG